MTRTDRRLLLAFILSLSFHTLPFLPLRTSVPVAPKKPPPLEARLKLLPLPAPAPILPPPSETAEEPPKVKTPKVLKETVKPTAAPSWENVVRQQMRKLKTEGRFYSKEAKELGLEGDPVILLVLDEAGNVTAARIEESSGHPILDRDALNAVKNLRYLPADAPREVQLPLRFRLED